MPIPFWASFSEADEILAAPPRARLGLAIRNATVKWLTESDSVPQESPGQIGPNQRKMLDIRSDSPGTRLTYDFNKPVQATHRNRLPPGGGPFREQGDH